MFISEMKIIFVFSILSVLTLFIGGCGHPDKGKTVQENSSGILTAVSDVADGVLSSVTPSSTENKCTELVDAHLSAVLHRDFDKVEKLDKQGVRLAGTFHNIISPQEEKRHKPGEIWIFGGSVVPVPPPVLQELTAKKMAAQKKITWKISTENLGDIKNAAGNRDGKDKYLVKVRWNTIDKPAFEKMLSELKNKYYKMSNDTKDEKYGTMRNKVFCEALAEILDNPPMIEEETCAIFNEKSENLFELLTTFYSVNNPLPFTSNDCGVWWYQNQDLCHIQFR